jgi:hypothetical protein
MISKINDNSTETISISVDFCKIVSFDLETSGFGNYILPTAPKLGENPLTSI